MSVATRFRLFLQGFEFRSSGKWFVLSTVVGIVAGLGAIAFQFLSQLVAEVALVAIAGFEPGSEHHYLGLAAPTFGPWLMLAVLIVGGLLSGWLVYSFAPEAEGAGTDAAIQAFHQNRGIIPLRVPFVKTLASAVTLGTGGSGGVEGPIAQIGAGLGSFLAMRLKLSARDRRLMLAAGMAAGVGALFRAPLAGALFAAEILYKDGDLESDVIVPSAISSIIAYSVYSLSLPPESRFEPMFKGLVEYAPSSPLELIPFAGLALVLVLLGIAYIKLFQVAQAGFRKLPVKPHFKPAIGAGLAGLVAIGLYYGMGKNDAVLSVLASGHASFEEALRNPAHLTLNVLVAIGIFKVITTTLTIGSGGSGGVFGPSIVIGACIGAAVGIVLHERWPALVPQPEVYAIVGMAGFFAGCAHAPISTILMVSEMTGSYDLLLPTMWVSTLCFLLCRRWTLYVNQTPSRIESPAHRGDFIIDILEGISVEDVYRKNQPMTFIREEQTLDDIVHLIARTQQHYFPVVDNDLRMIGIFSTDDVRAYFYDETIWHLAVARDIMTTEIVTVTPDDDLNHAMRRFTALNLDELPVVDPADSGKLLGMLRRKETIAAYNKRLAEHKQLASDDSMRGTIQ